jgi:hypothetical protein
MNARITPVLLGLVLFAPWLLVAAQPPARITPVPPVGPSPITPDCRWLFVVDTSSAMQRHADGLYRTAHRLVATGLGGRMRDGDVFTLWTYADTVLTREFPLNAWTPELNIALANRTYEFLQRQKFRGKSNLRPVFAELSQALAISANLTIVIVSDGTDVIVGTPFDRAINVTYGKRASEMRTAKMPFVTSLVTQRGEFTAWTVRGGLEDVGLPFREVSAPLAQTPPVTSATVAPAPAPAASSPSVVVPKPSAPQTNAPPAVVVTPAPAPKTPAPAPVAAKPVATPTNAVATVTPAAPKPDRPARTNAPAMATSSMVPRGGDPLPGTAPTQKPAPTNPPAPVSAPKQEAKVAPPAPPKPAAADAPKTAPAAPKSPVSAIPTNASAALSLVPSSGPAPAFVAPKSMPPVVPTLPSVIPPAQRQPKSVIEASNALAKVELLRPAVTSAPPAKPLEARVIVPPPTPPRATNLHAITVAKAVAASTNPAPVRLATNAPASAPAALPNIPVITPLPPAPKPLASKSPEKVVAPASNPPPAAVAAKVTERAEKTNAPAAVRPKPSSSASETNVAQAALMTNAPGTTNQLAAQLALADTGTRRGGWAYLAAAVALLVVAGGIIAHLLRPRPNPSVISQSLDDRRL